MFANLIENLNIEIKILEDNIKNMKEELEIKYKLHKFYNEINKKISLQNFNYPI